MRNTWYFIGTSLLSLAARATAQVASTCVTTDVCFELNIPSNTASSGTGDVFFQISAPSTYEWVALGQGTKMAGSNIFVVYVSSDGNNVTLSPRLGTGEIMPNFNQDAQVSLLDGSGVINGKMVANVKCSNCDSWSGGSMDFTSSKGSWIRAFKDSGGPKKSDDQSASISQHGNSDTGAFSWDFTSAKGGDSVNPLQSAAPSGGTVAATGSATSTSSCVPRPTTGSFASSGTGAFATATLSSFTSWPSSLPSQYSTSYPSNLPSQWRTHWPTAAPTGVALLNKRDSVNYCDSSNPSSENGATPLYTKGRTKEQKMLIAHGTLAALAFVIFFPAGAISIRLASFPGVVWFHAAFQVFSYITFLAAFALGVQLAREYSLLDKYHPVIGIVLFVVLFFQPIFGFLHHLLFKKYGSRTFWSYVHIWIGRIAITLGIINGGLGFKLASGFGLGSHTGMIVYAVIGGIAWLAMVLAAIIGERQRRAAKAGPGPKESPPMYRDSSNEAPPQQDHGAIPGNGDAQGYYGTRK